MVLVSRPARKVEALSSNRHLENHLPHPQAATHAIYYDSMWEEAGSMERVVMEAAADPRQEG